MQREELKEIAEILGNICSSSISFHDANVQIQRMKLDPERIKLDISYIGAVLRNSVSLNMMIDSYFLRLNKNLRNVLLIAMVAVRFNKSPEEAKDIRSLLEEEFRRFELENFFLSLKNLFSSVENDERLIPQGVKPNTVQYFSCLYNVPLDLFKMWVKQYGIRTAIRVASSFGRRAPLVYRTNTNKITSEELLKTAPQGLKATDVPEILSYTGKSPIRGTREFKEGLLFKTQRVAYDLVDGIDFEGKDTLIYLADDSTIPFEVMLASQKKNGAAIDILTNSDAIKYPLMQKSNVIRNTKQYVRVSGFDGLEAYLHKKYPNVVYIPRSTKLDDVSARPELLLQLRLDSLDSLVFEQLEGLTALSEFVEEYGYLYYIVPTLSKKETNRLIHSFVSENPTFSIVNERQCFPHEKGGATLYYAILKKEPAKDGEN